jgi:hypothetical protein
VEEEKKKEVFLKENKKKRKEDTNLFSFCLFSFQKPFFFFFLPLSSHSSQAGTLYCFWFSFDFLLAWELKAKPSFDFLLTPFWHGETKQNQTQTRLSLFLLLV